MGQEVKLQNRILADVKARRLAGQPIWFQKWSDRFTAGLPDLIGCVRGRLLAIELKSEGKTATFLQKLTLERIQKAGGRAVVIDAFEQWTRLIDKILALGDA